jgi:hypothetical protein
MSSTPGYVTFEKHDFHAHSAFAHSKAADSHAQSAMMEADDAYNHHLKAAKAHDDAARAHQTTAQNLPLPVNASPSHEGTPVATVHTKLPTPVLDKQSITVPKGKK